MTTSRRSFILRASATAACAALTSRGHAARTDRQRMPNIVVILSDDVGYGDLSCYGATDVKTPCIDALASAGRRFTDAHSDAATCTPSRYAMLTGSYAWRRDGVQILPGDARLLIDPNQPTIPSILKAAGYRTGLVGKWHIGLGDGKIDWNGEIKPGPCEAGFDDAFFFAATADRVPTVYIHDHRVVGLDPKDPIRVSYEAKVGTDPTGCEHPELLKMKLSEGHDGTIVDGVSRIGFMSGGNSARWKDEEMAATFTNKAVEFIEENQSRPFLLYFTPSDIHVPRMPAKQFEGKSACGVRCDVIDQLDWSVGRITATLTRLGLERDTLVLFTSDNGPVVNDGYDDGSDRKLDGHKPAGPYRGGKYTTYEGGTRIPFIVSWPGHVVPGASSALISQVDLLASLAALTGQALPSGGKFDSVNVLPALLGESRRGRTVLVEEGLVLAIREGQWKLIDRNQTPGAHPVMASMEDEVGLLPPEQKHYPLAQLELYNLANDPYETSNLASQFPDVVTRLRRKLAVIRNESIAH